MDARDLRYLKAMFDAGLATDIVMRIMEIAQEEESEQTGPPPASTGKRRGRPPKARDDDPPHVGNAALEGDDIGEEPEEELSLQTPQERRAAYNRAYYEKKKREREGGKLTRESSPDISVLDKLLENLRTEISGDTPLTRPLVQAPTYGQVVGIFEEVTPSKAPFLFRLFNTLTSRFTIQGRGNEGIWAVSTDGSILSPNYYSLVFSNLLSLSSTTPRTRSNKPTPRVREGQTEFALVPYEATVDIFAQAVLAYNEQAVAYGWQRVARLTGTRKAQLRARLRDAGGLDGWRELMVRAGRSSFLRGEAPRKEEHQNWRPDFDFFVRSSAFVKLLEGHYDDKEPVGKKIDGMAVIRAIGDAARKRIAERNAARI